MFINLYYFISLLPKIIGGIVVITIAFLIARSFYRRVFLAEDGLTFRNIYDFFDPYKQSLFCYKYNFFIILGLLTLIGFLCYIYVPAATIEDGKYFKPSLLINSITYLPNYLIHEFSHRFWAVLGWDWWTYASGNGMEFLIPCIIYLFSLQLRGGLLFSPILFYWIATTLYDAGFYASDAVVSKLALTSSDMVSNFKPGELKGDWYYILKPLGLLDYAQQIGMALEILACVFLAFSIYSIINYLIYLCEPPNMENTTY